MNKITTIFALLFCTVLITNPISAQNTSMPPLLRMLAFVPGTPEVLNSEVAYVDYRALVEARPGAAHPKNYREWLDIREQTTPESKLFRAAIRGDLLRLSGFFINPELMVKAVGIDPFAIQQAVKFGNLPADALVLDGQFDPITIGKALEAKGFLNQTLDPYMVWCGPEGCESGVNQNLEEKDFGNPFGGGLGRKQPIAVSASNVFSSAEYQVVQNILKASQGKLPLLIDVPDYQATAEVFTDSGTLIQAFFLPQHLVIKFLIGPFSLGSLSPAEAKDKLEKAIAEFVPIPQYSLVGFAHIVDKNNELTLVTLVYDQAADAQKAQDVIMARIPKYQTLARGKLLTDQFKERGGSLDVPRIYASKATGKYVLVFTLHAAVETNESAKDATPLKDSGLLFSLLTSSWTNRDLGWLATVQ